MPLDPNNQQISIKETYGISFATAKRLVREKYTSYAAAKTALPAGVGYLEFLGATQDEVMNCYEHELCWLDALAATDAPLGSTFRDFSNGIGSRAHLIAMEGSFPLTIPYIFASGKYTFMGSGTWHDATLTTSGTCLYIDAARWKARLFPEMNALQSENYMRKSGWQESFIIEGGLRIEGAHRLVKNNPAIKSYGVAVYDSGEASRLDDIYAMGFNDYGFKFVKGTPGNLRNLSSFENGIGGYLFDSTSLATIVGVGLSGDDNGETLVDFVAGEAPAGGTITLINLKSETGTRIDKTTGLPRVQSVARVRGAANVKIQGISAQVHAGRRPHAFDVDFRQPSGVQYESQLNVENYRECGNGPGAGYDQLLRNHNSEWTGYGLNQIIDFKINKETVIASSILLTKRAVSTTPVDPPPPPPPPQPTPAPTIDTFTVSPTSVVDSGSVTLAWTTTNANGVVITGGNGNVSSWPNGSIVLQVSTTTTYTLTATGPGGQATATRTVTVWTTPPPPPPPPPTTTYTTGVIVNSNDPQSAAIGARYVEKFGGKIVTVSLPGFGPGNQSTTVAAAQAARAKINAELGPQHTKLAVCMSFPTRVEVSGNGTSSQHKHGSILYALTHQFDANTNMNATWTPGARTATWVKDTAMTDRAALAHKNGQTGTVYAWSTFDAQPSNPRGAAVANYSIPLVQGTPALPAGISYSYFDNRPNWPAAGQSAPNFGQLYNQVFVRNKADFLGYFIGLGGPVYYVETNTIRRGAIGSNITSYGGRVGQNYGQQGLEMFIDRGLMMFDGSVSEPGSADNRRFLDPRIALPALYSGKTLAEVYREGVIWPVRNLCAGCPDAAPYAK